MTHSLLTAPALILVSDGPDLREHFAYLRKRADVLACCGLVDNLQIFEQTNKCIRAICTKCNRKHLLMLAEPGRVGAKR